MSHHAGWSGDKNARMARREFLAAAGIAGAGAATGGVLDLRQAQAQQPPDISGQFVA